MEVFVATLEHEKSGLVLAKGEGVSARFIKSLDAMVTQPQVPLRFLHPAGGSFTLPIRKRPLTPGLLPSSPKRARGETAPLDPRRVETG